MKGPLGNKIRIQHILDAVAEIEAYIDGVSKDQFLSNSEKRFATIKQIEIIGEACNKITPEFQSEHPEIPWNQVIGFRNISIHEYHNVSFPIVWDIAKHDIPILKENFEMMLSKMR
ncbi:MAG TPA: DUF86 domain-containing protein [Chitinophagaceae bacterium]|nr:DUF86 domain-containing protein [Chitinophagaceae bacterium]